MIQHHHLPPAHHHQEKTTQEHASHHSQTSYHSQNTPKRPRTTIPVDAAGRISTKDQFPWTVDEDDRLASLCESGRSYKELGREFQRTPGAINARLMLLEQKPAYTSLKTFRDRQHAHLMIYWGPVRKARLPPLLEQGKSDAEIADILDIDMNIITARRLRLT